VGFPFAIFSGGARVGALVGAGLLVGTGLNVGSVGFGKTSTSARDR